MVFTLVQDSARLVRLVGLCLDLVGLDCLDLVGAWCVIRAQIPDRVRAVCPSVAL
jgi:hypothetical protein